MESIVVGVICFLLGLFISMCNEDRVMVRKTKNISYIVHKKTLYILMAAPDVHEYIKKKGVDTMG